MEPGTSATRGTGHGSSEQGAVRQEGTQNQLFTSESNKIKILRPKLKECHPSRFNDPDNVIKNRRHCDFKRNRLIREHRMRRARDGSKEREEEEKRRNEDAERKKWEERYQKMVENQNQWLKAKGIKSEPDCAHPNFPVTIVEEQGNLYSITSVEEFNQYVVRMDEQILRNNEPEEFLYREDDDEDGIIIEDGVDMIDDFEELMGEIDENDLEEFRRLMEAAHELEEEVLDPHFDEDLNPDGRVDEAPRLDVIAMNEIDRVEQVIMERVRARAARLRAERPVRGPARFNIEMRRWEGENPVLRIDDAPPMLVEAEEEEVADFIALFRDGEPLPNQELVNVPLILPDNRDTNHVFWENDDIADWIQKVRELVGRPEDENGWDERLRNYVRNQNLNGIFIGALEYGSLRLRDRINPVSNELFYELRKYAGKVRMEHGLRN